MGLIYMKYGLTRANMKIRGARSVGVDLLIKFLWSVKKHSMGAAVNNAGIRLVFSRLEHMWVG